MKEFIDKLISRLEEEKKEYSRMASQMIRIGNDEIHCHYERMFVAMCNAIDIVNELAEEYKGGWIPCSKQEEPTENGKYLVYVQHYSNKDLYDTCLVDWFGEWKVSYEWNVIAWHPIAPYTEGE